MKTLLLLRHAKSSWDDERLDDHDRPLNDRGRRAAPRMGNLLREERIVPDLIISSTAKRARSTARLVAEAASFEREVALEPSLYLASPEGYVRAAQPVDDSVERLMMVGHNPGIETLLGLLTGQGEAMPTAALAVLTVPIDRWSELTLDVRCELLHLWRPKDL